MNKKGIVEVFAITMVILTLLIVSTAFLQYEGKFDNIQYIGDNSTKIVYNLKSNNSDCDYQNIQISKDNIIIFNNLQEATTQNKFNLSNQCN